MHEKEKEANLFAMYLLMPSEMIDAIMTEWKTEHGDCPIDSDSDLVRHLAKIFKVSETVMTRRLMLEPELIEKHFA